MGVKLPCAPPPSHTAHEVRDRSSAYEPTLLGLGIQRERRSRAGALGRRGVDGGNRMRWRKQRSPRSRINGAVATHGAKDVAW